MKKEYKKGGMTIVWESEKCIHSGICARGLPAVFNPSARPWVQVENSEEETIKNQIDACPSGALSYYMKEQINDMKNGNDAVKIQVVSNGPLLIKSDCLIVHKDGTEEIRENRVSLCRCGASSNKPYCDGTHKGLDFDQ